MSGDTINPAGGTGMAPTHCGERSLTIPLSLWEMPTDPLSLWEMPASPLSLWERVRLRAV